MYRWDVEQSKYLVNDEWLKLQAQRVRTPEGAVLDPYYVMEYPDWVNCLIVQEDATATIVEQYRHGAGQIIRGLPAGAIDAGETPEDAIRRELAEEIGYAGGELFPTITTFSNAAMLTNVTHSFVAFGGKLGNTTNHDAGETTIKAIQIPLRELLHDLAAHPGAASYQVFHATGIYAAVEFIKQSDHPYVVKLRQQLA